MSGASEERGQLENEDEKISKKMQEGRLGWYHVIVLVEGENADPDNLELLMHIDMPFLPRVGEIIDDANGTQHRITEVRYTACYGDGMGTLTEITLICKQDS